MATGYMALALNKDINHYSANSKQFIPNVKNVVQMQTQSMHVIGLIHHVLIQHSAL